MSYGLIIMVVLSILIARQARQRSRSGILWIIIIWVFAFLGGFLVASVAWVFVVFPSVTPLSEHEAARRLVIPCAIGMLLGVIGVFVAVNRKPRGALKATGMNQNLIVRVPMDGKWDFVDRFRNFGADVFRALRDSCFVSIDEIAVSTERFAVRDVPVDKMRQTYDVIQEIAEKHFLAERLDITVGDLE